MLHAMVFDFDGVLADTEPLHYRAFEQVLADRSIRLTQSDYFSKYVGLNDRAFLEMIFRDHGVSLSPTERATLQTNKDAAYQQLIVSGLSLLPGARDFVEAAARSLPLAICSGARRVEIESILEKNLLSTYFKVIVSADEVAASKPDPAGYLRTLELLRGNRPDLRADDCLALEDSLLGLRAAKAAGMKALVLLGAADHSSGVDRSARAAAADAAFDSWQDVHVEDLHDLFA